MNIKKLTTRLGLLALASTLLFGCQQTNHQSEEATVATEATPEEKLGFKLSVGSYSFKNFTFLEALDKIDSCQISNTEGFPNHTLGGTLEGTLTYKMDTTTRTELLKIMNEKGIKLAAYGVITPETKEEWIELFEFAKVMGIETITSEPQPSQLPMIAELADQYKVRVAIHNHPAPSLYAHPDSVLKAIDGLGTHIGVAADVGHWLRSGLDPVECLKKVEGRLMHFHMKDLNQKGVREAHDVIWGQGATNVLGIIEEVKRQKFNGIMSVEYEYNWNNSVPDIIKSVEFLRNNL